MTSLQLRRRVKGALRVLLADTPLGPQRATRAAVADDEPHVSPRTPCPSGPILELATCPLCGHSERTLVSEFNRFVLMERRPDDAAALYNYCLCHGCGVTYASKRPAGERYRWLLEHFEETIGRDETLRNPAKLTVSSFALSEDDKAELRRRAAKGVFVSEHLGLSRKEYLPLLTADRLANSVHVELIGSLLELHAPRVLEIRSRAGSIGASIKRLYGGETYAMTLFENQRFVIEHVYGTATSALVDFDHFQIPYDGAFDVIVSNHMLTHAVRPREFLEEVRQHLNPGGHLYLYNEPDDAEYVSEGKSMFNTLNAFHLQAFDGPSLTRALAANGFAVRFLTRYNGSFLCLAAVQPGTEPALLSAADLERRRAAHLRARDASILMVPPHVRSRVAGEWDAAAARAVSAGIAEIREDGQLRVRRPRG